MSDERVGSIRVTTALIGLAFGLAVQLAGIVWVASDWSARLDRVEQDVTGLQAIWPEIRELRESTARIEQKIDSLTHQQRNSR